MECEICKGIFRDWGNTQSWIEGKGLMRVTIGEDGEPRWLCHDCYMPLTPGWTEN